MENQSLAYAHKRQKIEYGAAADTVQISHNKVEIKENYFASPVNININQISTNVETHPATAIKYGVPLNLEKIIGRDEDADKVLALLQTINARPVVICGIGGIGKTSLSLYCSQRWTESGIVQDVAFLNTETENDFCESVKGFARYLKIETKDILTLEIVRQIYNHYEMDERKVLIIFDNIEKCNVIKGYLPPQNQPNILLIATSQNIELDAFFNIYPLYEITYETSIELLNSLLPHQENKHTVKDIEDLARTFAGLPLGLRQAAAYITDVQKYEDSQYTIKDYLQQYSQLFNELPDNIQLNYNKSLHISLEMNIAKINNNKKSSLLLKCIACCNTAELKLPYFETFYEQLTQFNYPINLIELKRAFRVLRQYSLIAMNERSDWKYGSCTYIHIHRIVQDFCRNAMTHDEKSKCIVILFLIWKTNVGGNLRDFLSCLENLITDTDFETLTLCFRDIFQVEEIRSNLMNQFKHLGIDISIMQDWNVCHYVFHLEIWREDLRTIVSILSTKRTYSACNNTSKWRLIHSAAMCDKWCNGVPVLLECMPLAVCDIDAQTEYGFTSLHIATVLNHRYNVQYLIQRGCDANIEDSRGNTAFTLALQNDHLNVLHILINTNQYDKLFSTEGKKIIDNINSRFPFKCCVNVVRSTTGATFRRLLVAWEVYEDTKEAEKILIDKFKGCNWWNEQQGALVPEIVELLYRSTDALYLVREYVCIENITLSDLMEMLRKDEPHPVLNIVTEESLYPAARYVYKMICIAIDTLIERCPEAYNLLSAAVYCNTETSSLYKFGYYSHITTENIDRYHTYLGEYGLNIGFFSELVACVVRTYVGYRNETRHLLQQVLRMENGPDLTDSEYKRFVISDSDASATSDVQYTDEQIDEYLKKFYTIY